MFSPDGFELSLFVIRSTFEGTRTRTRTRTRRAYVYVYTVSCLLPSSVRKYFRTKVLSYVLCRFDYKKAELYNTVLYPSGLVFMYYRKYEGTGTRTCTPVVMYSTKASIFVFIRTKISKLLLYTYSTV